MQLYALCHKDVETLTAWKEDEETKKWSRSKAETCHATDAYGSTKIAHPPGSPDPGPHLVLASTWTVFIDESLDIEWLLAISPHILTIIPFRIIVY